jgi:hypothetical protein
LARLGRSSAEGSWSEKGQLKFSAGPGRNVSGTRFRGAHSASELLRGILLGNRTVDSPRNLLVKMILPPHLDIIFEARRRRLYRAF